MFEIKNVSKQYNSEFALIFHLEFNKYLMKVEM